MLQAIRSLILWTYGRTTWQYDMLCILILVFIFLSPPRWFRTESPTVNQNPDLQATSVWLINFQDGDSRGLSPTEIEARVRELSGKPTARVKSLRPVKESTGETVGYAVDIEVP